MNTQFAKAVELGFPNLDESTRQEIEARITEHMLEFLKSKIFQGEELEAFDAEVKQLSDVEKRSASYAKGIMEKLASLPQDSQQQIDQQLDAELTRVMQQVYQSLN